MKTRTAKGRGLKFAVLVVAVLGVAAYPVGLPGLSILLALALLPLLLLLLLRKLDSSAAVEPPPEGKLPNPWQGDGFTGGRGTTGL